MRTDIIQASELLQKNTPEAIEQAIGLLQHTVFSFSMKMCGHRQDAEDTMQEVLFRSLKYLTKLEGPNALAAWLYTVTRNRCHRMRRGHLEGNEKKLSFDELIPDDEELRRLLLVADGGPERDAIQAEQHHLLHEAVLRLPTPLRMVLVLQDMEELSSEEIAKILQLQTGTVRVRLHRARLAVRKEMSQLLKRIPEKTAEKVDVTQRPRECRELFANLSEYLDARVEPRTCEEMKAHIERCPACIAFLKDLRAAIDRCRTFEVACDPHVAQRMRVLMKEEYLRLIGSPAGRLPEFSSQR